MAMLFYWCTVHRWNTMLKMHTCNRHTLLCQLAILLCCVFGCRTFAARSSYHPAARLNAAQPQEPAVG